MFYEKYLFNYLVHVYSIKVSFVNLISENIDNIKRCYKLDKYYYVFLGIILFYMT